MQYDHLYIIDHLFTFINDDHSIQLPKLATIMAGVTLGGWLGDGILTVSALTGALGALILGTCLNRILGTRV
jgi:hypothetical protein